MKSKGMNFTNISSIPSWMIDSPKPAKETKPKPRGAELRIEKRIPDLDSVPTGNDVTLVCKGKLAMRRAEESADKRHVISMKSRSCLSQS